MDEVIQEKKGDKMPDLYKLCYFFLLAMTLYNNIVTYKL